MANPTEWIKQHKTAVAVGTAAVIGLLLLTRKSGAATSGSTGASSIQLAQLQASQNLSQAQIQAQQNVATLQARSQQNQTSAQLQAEQDQLATTLALNLSANGSQFALAKEQLDNQTAQQSAYDRLVEALSPTAFATATRGGPQNSITGLNELAILFGEENATGPFNSSLSQEAVGSKAVSDQLLASLFKTGGGVLQGLGL